MNVRKEPVNANQRLQSQAVDPSQRVMLPQRLYTPFSRESKPA